MRVLTVLPLTLASLMPWHPSPAGEAVPAPEQPAPAAPRPVLTAQDLDAAISSFRKYYDSGRSQSISRQSLSYATQGQVNQKTPEDRLAACRTLLAAFTADGTWPDIDYSDQRPSGWTLLRHPDRAILLAVAASGTVGDAAERAAFAAAADRAISTWRQRRFKNPNWWNNDFGAPILLGTAGLLLGDGLSADNRAFLVKLTHRLGAKGFGTVGGGGNEVWALSRRLIGALLARDAASARVTADALWRQALSPITVPEEQRAPGVNAIEGIQPDASFHQHGPQMQMGNYGLSFSVDMASWAVILRDTALAMPPDLMAAFRGYLLDGQDWVYWRGRIDINGIGRQFKPYTQSAKYAMVCQPFADLAEFDPSAAAASRAFAARNQSGAKNDLTGFRWFWRSDYGVVRNPGFFASVRLHSSHTKGWESVNGENLQGQHLPDGVAYLFTSGGEYDEIFPVWDWKRLPGITHAASETIQPQLVGVTGATGAPPTASPIQAGGVGNGHQGCIAYQHHDKQAGVSARKAWFSDREVLVCLGAGISGTGKEQPIITSVNQCLGRGPVRASVGGRVEELPAGALRQLSADWIEHDGLRYEFPAAGALLAGIATQTGLWQSVSTAVKSHLEPQSQQVFSLLIDHGRLPSAGTYAYAVRPVGTATATYRIVANTADQQAVAWDDRRCAVVFWQPGTITWATGRTIQTDAPCLVNLDGDQVSVSDPTWNLTRVELTIDGKLVPVNLRTDPGYAGSTVTMSIVTR